VDKELLCPLPVEAACGITMRFQVLSVVTLKIAVFYYTGCGKLTSFFIWHFIFKKGS
jgi:hypothetical protein